MKRVPWENRAFDSGGQVTYAGEYDESAQMVGVVKIQRARGHVTEFLDQRLSIDARLAFYNSGHHGCRRLADRTGLAMERNAFDMFPFEVQINIKVIATQRIVPHRVVACPVQLAVIARFPVVVEDDLLIKGFRSH